MSSHVKQSTPSNSWFWKITSSRYWTFQSTRSLPKAVSPFMTSWRRSIAFCNPWTFRVTESATMERNPFPKPCQKTGLWFTWTWLRTELMTMAWKWSPKVYKRTTIWFLSNCITTILVSCLWDNSINCSKESRRFLSSGISPLTSSTMKSKWLTLRITLKRISMFRKSTIVESKRCFYEFYFVFA